MADYWTRIEAWLRTNAPDILQDLNPGATDADIASAEQALGLTLPEDMRTAYRLHNGSAGASAPLMGDWYFLALQHMTARWRTMKELADKGTFEGNEVLARGPMKDDWWNARWLPVADNGAGDYRCADLDPGPGGAPGQIVSFWHADDRREVIAPSFSAWLEAFANDLEQGRYTVDGGWLVQPQGR